MKIISKKTDARWKRHNDTFGIDAYLLGDAKYASITIASLKQLFDDGAKQEAGSSEPLRRKLLRMDFTADLTATEIVITRDVLAGLLYAKWLNMRGSSAGCLTPTDSANCVPIVQGTRAACWQSDWTLDGVVFKWLTPDDLAELHRERQETDGDIRLTAQVPADATASEVRFISGFTDSAAAIMPMITADELRIDGKVITPPSANPQTRTDAYYVKDALELGTQIQFAEGSELIDGSPLHGTAASLRVKLDDNVIIAGCGQDEPKQQRSIEEEIEYSVGIAVEEYFAGVRKQLYAHKARADTQAAMLWKLDNKITVIEGRARVAVWEAAGATFLICIIAFVIFYYYFA